MSTIIGTAHTEIISNTKLLMLLLNVAALPLEKLLLHCESKKPTIFFVHNFAKCILKIFRLWIQQGICNKTVATLLVKSIIKNGEILTCIQQ